MARYVSMKGKPLGAPVVCDKVAINKVLGYLVVAVPLYRKFGYQEDGVYQICVLEPSPVCWLLYDASQVVGMLDEAFNKHFEVLSDL